MGGGVGGGCVGVWTKGMMSCDHRSVRPGGSSPKPTSPGRPLAAVHGHKPTTHTTHNTTYKHPNAPRGRPRAGYPAHFGGKGRTVQGEKRQQAKRRVRCAPARTERTFSHNTTHTCCFLAGRRNTGKPTMQRAEELPQGTRRKRKKVPVLCLSFLLCLIRVWFIHPLHFLLCPNRNGTWLDSCLIPPSSLRSLRLAAPPTFLL